MQVPPPSQVLPSCVRWVLGGARQANLDRVTSRGRTPERTVVYVRMLRHRRDRRVARASFPRPEKFLMDGAEAGEGGTRSILRRM
jgi:hypothetical protein